MATVRILSLDGGGIRGIISAHVLHELIGDRPVHEVFHMVAGTSIGGITACGLTISPPMSPLALRELYARRGDEVFGRRKFWGLPGANLLEEKYSAASLEAILAEILGDLSLSDVDNIDLLVPAYAIELPRPTASGETRAPMFFRNWRARGKDLPDGARAAEYDFRLRDVGRATSAAPTYFEPAEVRSAAGETFGAVDGGVFANNPTMCALVDAYRRYGRHHDYVVVSLGTGYLQRDIPLEEARDWGLVGWTRPLINILMDGSSDTVCHQVERLHGADHFRFDIPLGRTAQEPFAVNDDLDDTSARNIDALLTKSEILVGEQSARLADLRRRLDGPKDVLGRPEVSASG